MLIRESLERDLTRRIEEIIKLDQIKEMSQLIPNAKLEWPKEPA